MDAIDQSVGQEDGQGDFAVTIFVDATFGFRTPLDIYNDRPTPIFGS